MIHSIPMSIDWVLTHKASDHACSELPSNPQFPNQVTIAIRGEEL